MDSAADWSKLRHPAVVMAFSGWNDAGNAASGAIAHLGEAYAAEVMQEIDSEDYYDFQVNRPVVTRDAPGVSRIAWPKTQVLLCALPERDVVLIVGPEPNLRWRQFCRALGGIVAGCAPELVVMLGALLADTPHSRPIQVSASAPTLELADRLGVDVPSYEGPSGIVGLLADTLSDAGQPVCSLWASVPHYVAQPPNPKAVLALIRRLEDLLDVTLELGELNEESRAWERGVDELAAEDGEIAEYIAALEEQSDETDLPEASGDAIAAEFERYLKRRGG